MKKFVKIDLLQRYLVNFLQKTWQMTSKVYEKVYLDRSSHLVRTEDSTNKHKKKIIGRMIFFLTGTEIEVFTHFACSSYYLIKLL
jgi:hypothetical protein